MSPREPALPLGCENLPVIPATTRTAARRCGVDPALPEPRLGPRGCGLWGQWLARCPADPGVGGLCHEWGVAVASGRTTPPVCCHPGARLSVPALESLSSSAAHWVSGAPPSPYAATGPQIPVPWSPQWGPQLSASRRPADLTGGSGISCDLGATARHLPRTGGTGSAFTTALLCAGLS